VSRKEGTMFKRPVVVAAAVLLAGLLSTNMSAPVHADESSTPPPEQPPKEGNSPYMGISNAFHDPSAASRKLAEQAAKKDAEMADEAAAASTKGDRPAERGYDLRTTPKTNAEIQAVTGGVVELTPQNWDQHVRGNKHVFIKFYAPWCGHCQRLTGPWKQLALTVGEKPTLRAKVVIAKCDVDKYADLRTKWGVQSYPTLNWFNSNMTQGPLRKPYTGERNYDALFKFLQENSRNRVKVNRVFAYDMLAWKFTSATDIAYRREVVDALKRSLESEATHESHRLAGDVYLKIMEKAVKKSEEVGVEAVGIAYFEEEQERLTRLLKDESLSDDKVNEFENRKNIVDSFAKQNLDPLAGMRANV